MAEEEQDVPLYVDFTPNYAGDPQLVDGLRASLHERLDRDIEGILDRGSQLPILMVHNRGEYVDLLVEARELYRYGFFYACVAMCGIVSERIIKDGLRAAIHVQTRTGTVRPSETAFDQLEHVDIASLTRFISACGIISDDTQRAADKLVQIRNKYAHARGKNPQSDALKAIEHLHAIVDGTVSVFKDFTICEGRLVLKDAARGFDQSAHAEPREVG